MAFPIIVELQFQARNAQISGIVTNIRRELENIPPVSIKINIDDKVNASIAKLNGELANVSKNLQQIEVEGIAATRAIAGLGSALGGVSNFNTLAVQAVGSTRQITDSTRIATTSVQALGEQAARAVRNFAGYAIAVGSIVALTSAIREGVTEGVAFERQITKLQQVSGQSRGDLAGLEGEIRKVAQAYGSNAVELTAVAGNLVKAGLSIEQTKGLLNTLGQTTVSPNFKNLEDTVQGIIPVMKQFNLTIDQTKEAISSFNAIASSSNVSVSDIFSAVKEAGGTFKAAGGDVREFAASFATIKQATGDTADAVAAAIKIMVANLQRGATVDAFKQLRVELRYTAEEAKALGNINLTGQFVGPFEAIKRISDSIRSNPSTARGVFAELDIAGGDRQINKVIPLIQNYTEAQKLLNVAQLGSNSLAQQAAVAQASLGNQIDRTKAKFEELFRIITADKGFQSLAEGILKLARGLEQVLEFATPLLPVLTAIAGVKLAQGLAGVAAGFTSATSRVSAGTTRGFAGGGFVPDIGKGSNIDSVPAMLTPGEFVLRKAVAQQIGYGKLHSLNAGSATHYAQGGEVKSHTAYVYDFDNTLASANNKDRNLSEADKIRTAGPTPVARQAAERGRQGYDTFILTNRDPSEAGVAGAIKQFTNAVGIQPKNIIMLGGQEQKYSGAHGKAQLATADVSIKKRDTLRELRTRYDNIEFFDDRIENISSAKTIEGVRAERVVGYGTGGQVYKRYSEGGQPSYDDIKKYVKLFSQTEGVDFSKVVSNIRLIPEIPFPKDNPFANRYNQAAGLFVPSEKTVLINAGFQQTEQTLKDILGHELGHAIDFYSGRTNFASAQLGTPEYFLSERYKPVIARRIVTADRVQYKTQGVEPFAELARYTLAKSPTFGESLPESKQAALIEENFKQIALSPIKRRGTGVSLEQSLRNINFFAVGGDIPAYFDKGGDYTPTPEDVVNLTKKYSTNTGRDLRKVFSNVDIVPNLHTEESYGNLIAGSPIAGHYNYSSGKISLNTAYISDKKDLEQVFAHELGHGIDSYIVGRSRNKFGTLQATSVESQLAGSFQKILPFSNYPREVREYFASNKQEGFAELTRSVLAPEYVGDPLFKPPKELLTHFKNIQKLYREQVLTKLPQYTEGGNVPAYYQSGSETAISPSTPIGKKIFIQQLENFQKQFNVTGGSRAQYHLNNILESQHAPEILKEIPKGATYLSAGREALVLKLPNANVLRISREADTFKTGIFRPEIPEVLQPISSKTVGDFKLEQLPFTPAIDTLNLPTTTQFQISDALKQRSFQQGLYPFDVAERNIGRTPSGQFKIIDPNAVAPISEDLANTLKRPISDLQKELANYQPKYEQSTVKSLLGYAQGGSTDTVPAMLTPGEFVFNREAVSRVGISKLRAINEGRGSPDEWQWGKGYAYGGVIPGYADGNQVDPNTVIVTTVNKLAQFASKFELTSTAFDKLLQQVSGLGVALDGIQRVALQFQDGLLKASKVTAIKPEKVIEAQFQDITPAGSLTNQQSIASLLPFNRPRLLPPPALLFESNIQPDFIVPARPEQNVRFGSSQSPRLLGFTPEPQPQFTPDITERERRVLITPTQTQLKIPSRQAILRGFEQTEDLTGRAAAISQLPGAGFAQTQINARNLQQNAFRQVSVAGFVSPETIAKPGEVRPTIPPASQTEIQQRQSQIVDALIKQQKVLDETLTNAQARVKAEAQAALLAQQDGALVEKIVKGKKELLGSLENQIAIETGNVTKANLFQRAGVGLQNLGVVPQGFFDNTQNTVNNVTTGTAFGRGLSRVGGFFNSQPGFLAAAIGGPIINAGIESVGGTAEQAVAGGSPRLFTTARIAQGTISGGLTGGVASSLIVGAAGLTGPIGLLVIGLGAAVAGLLGFVSGLKGASDELSKAKITQGTRELTQRATDLGTGAIQFSPGRAQAINQDITQLNEQVNRSAEAASRGLFGFGNLNKDTFNTELANQRSQVFGPALPGIVQTLNRSAEQIGKTNTQTPVGELSTQFAATNQAGIQLIAQTQKIPFDEVAKRFQEVIRGGQSESRGVIALQPLNAQLTAFETLTRSVITAANDLTELSNRTKIFSDTISGGVIKAIPPNFTANLQTIGSADNTGFLQSVRAITTPLGNAGRQLGFSAQAADVVKRFSDQAIIQTAQSQAPGSAPINLGVKFTEEINRAAGNLGPGLQQAFNVFVRAISANLDKLTQKDFSQFQQGIQSGDVSKITEQLINPILSPVQNALKQIGQILESEGQRLAAGFAQYADQQNRIDSERITLAQTELGGTRLQTELSARAEGVFSPQGILQRIPLETLQKPFQTQQTLLNPRGLSIEGIGGRLQDITKEQLTLNTANVNAPNIKNIEQLSALGNEASRLQTALHALSDVTARAAPIQEKLNSINAERSGRLNLGERVLTAEPDELFRLQRGAQLANIAQINPNVRGLSASDAKSLFEFTHLTENIPLQTGGTGADLRRRIIENSVPGIGQLPPTRQAEEANLLGKLQAVYDSAKEANLTFISNLTSNQNNFITDLRAQTDRLLAGIQELVQKQQAQAAPGELAGLFAGRQAIANRPELATLKAAGVETQEQLEQLRAPSNLQDLTLIQQGYAKAREAQSAQLAIIPQARELVTKVTANPYAEIQQLQPLLQERGVINPENALRAYRQSRVAGQTEEQRATLLEKSLRDTASQTFIDTLYEGSTPKRQAQLREGTGGLIPKNAGEALINQRRKGTSNDIIGIAESPQGEAFINALSSTVSIKEATTQINQFNAEIIKLTSGLNGLLPALAGIGDGIQALASLPKLSQSVGQINAFNAVPGLAQGGDTSLIKLSPRGTDTVPALLTPGEFVVNAGATARHRATLEKINNGVLSYARGGVVEYSDDVVKESAYKSLLLNSNYIPQSQRRQFAMGGEAGGGTAYDRAIVNDIDREFAFKSLSPVSAYAKEREGKPFQLGGPAGPPTGKRGEYSYDIDVESAYASKGANSQVAKLAKAGTGYGENASGYGAGGGTAYDRAIIHDIDREFAYQSLSPVSVYTKEREGKAYGLGGPAGVPTGERGEYSYDIDVESAYASKGPNSQVAKLAKQGIGYGENSTGYGAGGGTAYDRGITNDIDREFAYQSLSPVSAYAKEREGKVFAEGGAIQASSIISQNQIGLDNAKDQIKSLYNNTKTQSILSDKDVTKVKESAAGQAVGQDEILALPEYQKLSQLKPTAGDIQNTYSETIADIRKDQTTKKIESDKLTATGNEKTTAIGFAEGGASAYLNYGGGLALGVLPIQLLPSYREKKYPGYAEGGTAYDRSIIHDIDRETAYISLGPTSSYNKIRQGEAFGGGGHVPSYSGGGPLRFAKGGSVPEYSDDIVKESAYKSVNINSQYIPQSGRKQFAKGGLATPNDLDFLQHAPGYADGGTPYDKSIIHDIDRETAYASLGPTSSYNKIREGKMYAEGGTIDLNQHGSVSHAGLTSISRRHLQTGGVIGPASIGGLVCINDQGEECTAKQVEAKQFHGSILLNKTLPEAKGLCVGGEIENKGFALGGEMFVPQGTDTIPAMLTPGEYVINARSASKHRGLLQKINSGYFAEGGDVSSTDEESYNSYSETTKKLIGDRQFDEEGNRIPPKGSYEYLEYQRQRRETDRPGVNLPVSPKVEQQIAKLSPEQKAANARISRIALGGYDTQPSAAQIKENQRISRIAVNGYDPRAISRTRPTEGEYANNLGEIEAPPEGFEELPDISKQAESDRQAIDQAVRYAIAKPTDIFAQKTEKIPPPILRGEPISGALVKPEDTVTKISPITGEFAIGPQTPGQSRYQPNKQYNTADLPPSPFNDVLGGIIGGIGAGTAGNILGVIPPLAKDQAEREKVVKAIPEFYRQEDLLRRELIRQSITQPGGAASQFIAGQNAAAAFDKKYGTLPEVGPLTPDQEKIARRRELAIASTQINVAQTGQLAQAQQLTTLAAATAPIADRFTRPEQSLQTAQIYNSLTGAASPQGLSQRAAASNIGLTGANIKAITGSDLLGGERAKLFGVAAQENTPERIRSSPEPSLLPKAKKPLYKPSKPASETGTFIYPEDVRKKAKSNPFGPIPAYSTGGVIPGISSDDNQLISAQPGEYVIDKKTAQAVGYANLANLKNSVKHYEEGGPVGGLTTTSTQSAVNFGALLPPEAIQSLNSFKESANTIVSGFTTFDNSVVKLAESLTNFKIPDKISLDAAHTVHVAFTGSELLESISKNVSDLVVDKVKDEIQKMMKEALPDQAGAANISLS